MKPRLKALPLTVEDVRIWLELADAWRAPWRLPRDVQIWRYLESDRRDAELMLEAGWRCPGHAVITVDCGDDGLTTHSIAGRRERERFEHWLETEASEDDRRVILDHRAARCRA